MEVGAVDAVRAAVLEVIIEKRQARLGRVRDGVGPRVQDDVRVARLVGGVAGPDLLAGEWGRGGDGGAGEDEDGGQLHLDWLGIRGSEEGGYRRVECEVCCVV